MFLVSPARCDGIRADQLARSKGELGVQLRAGTARIGDVMTWLSALYFRGKLTYARRFATATYIMAPGLGLASPEDVVSVRRLRAMGRSGVESRTFVRALRRDAQALAQTSADARVVLLGSIATGKYVDTLLEVFGSRLLFPADFVGRGDMSRGGLLLRAAADGAELTYAPIAGAVLHGSRPPKLARRSGRGAVAA